MKDLERLAREYEAAPSTMSCGCILDGNIVWCGATAPGDVILHYRSEIITERKRLGLDNMKGDEVKERAEDQILKAANKLIYEKNADLYRALAEVEKQDKRKQVLEQAYAWLRMLPEEDGADIVTGLYDAGMLKLKD